MNSKKEIRYKYYKIRIFIVLRIKIGIRVRENYGGIEENRDLEPFFGDWKRRPKTPGQGQKRTTTPNEDHYLELMARRHRTIYATLLQQHFRSATGTTVSTQIVRNRLHGVGLCVSNRCDESTFEILQNKAQFVRHRRGEKIHSDCVVQIVKHPTKIMIWSVISVKGTGRLYVVKGMMRQDQYKDVLQNRLIRQLEEWFP
ncbi:uncharacterized protein TNCV_467731 [Trichonephila clavipes]|nr:uncharacterized protein TNCV_467731 [Trichonephila clavipes]